KHAFDYTQLLVTATFDNGDSMDVTRIAKLELPANVKASANGLVRPIGDGDGSIKATVGDKSLVIPLTVKGLKDKHEVSFIRDVMPAMSRLGCNAGTCHGSLEGKNGFKLSLRGYDPLYDHRALTDDLEGRRFNRAAPDRSLMLLKTSGAAPHTGGALMKPGEPSYELLKMWV